VTRRLRWRSRAARALCALAAGALLPLASGAHRLAPSLLELRELGGGSVLVRFKLPLLQASGVELAPELPPHCEPSSSPTSERDETSVTLRWSESCGERGLVGHEISVRGLAESRTDALVRIELEDGRTLRAVLSGSQARMRVPERESRRDVGASYLELGFDHILSGLDHLLFVLGLVLLVRGWRSLATTVTAFTLGHSVTLSLAVLGFVHFPTREAEILIAASIVLLAGELARPAGAAPTPMRRWPWAMALAFGLLHGFGFAGALAEVGLPAAEIPLALFSFNVGIELGQLLFVAVVLLLGRALRRWLAETSGGLARLPAYAIGSLAAYWCLERALGP